MRLVNAHVPKQSPVLVCLRIDFRSGVAIDPAIREFHGSNQHRWDDNVVFVGTTADG
jgi:hypothetical protein